MTGGKDPEMPAMDLGLRVFENISQTKIPT